MEVKEKSKIAIDGLVFALKELRAKTNQINRRLTTTQSKCKNTRVEVGSLKSNKIIEKKFQVVKPYS